MVYGYYINITGIGSGLCVARLSCAYISHTGIGSTSRLPISLAGIGIRFHVHLTLWNWWTGLARGQDVVVVVLEL